MEEVLAVLAECIRQVAILAQPVMPGNSINVISWVWPQSRVTSALVVARLSSGHKIEKPVPVFLVMWWKRGNG